MPNSEFAYSSEWPKKRHTSLIPHISVVFLTAMQAAKKVISCGLFLPGYIPARLERSTKIYP